MTKPKTPATPAPPSDPTRAPVAPPIFLRVRTIRRLMETGGWGPEAADELQAAWGVTAAMVRGHAAEASRQLEAVLDGVAAARQIEADLAAAVELAFSQGDPAAVQRLLETRLKLHGIGAHRDPKNDPLRAPQAPPPDPTAPPTQRPPPPWLKRKDQPS